MQITQNFRSHHLCASLALGMCISTATFAATEYSRSQDFRATTAGNKNSHTHGGFLAADANRWSYYLISAKQRQETGDLGELLGNPGKRIPLTGFGASVIGSNHFQRHAYQVSASGMSLIWNHNAENPATDLANASLAIFFQPPAAGTYSVAGDLRWRSTRPTDMRRGAGVTIGIVRADNKMFESLFKAGFVAPEAFSEPKPVEGFRGNAALQNLKLNRDDRIVFLWHSDSANYRGLEGIDEDVRIVHAEGESLPSDPDLIAELTAYQRLFSLIDLNRPELTEVRTLVGSGGYPAAMRAYTRHLAERLAELPRRDNFSYWLYGVANADQLLDGKLRTVKYGDTATQYVIDIGKPGSIDFFKAANDDYRTSIRDISSMHWASKHAEAYQKSKDPKYLHAWLATWDDFARNWEDQYAATRKDPTIWGRRTDGRTNLVGIDWLNAQLYLAWRLGSMHAGLLTCLQTAHDADQLDQVDPSQLARILVRVATVETARSRTWLRRAEHLVPNQIRSLANIIFTWGVGFSEFHDADWWRQESIPVFTLTYNPDGTDREHSLNYFNNNLKPLLALFRQMPAADRDPVLIAELEAKSAYRDRFIPYIPRPDGFTPPVGNSNIWRHYGESRELNSSSTAFTSIVFPYGGFAVQRDGWEPDSLYLFMKQTRPARGHGRSQDGSLQLSAYGRNLLISSVGEIYDGRGGWKNYWLGAAGQNMILVNGMSPQRRNSGFDTLDPWLWHTSETIEFMETEMTGPYGGGDFRVDGAVRNETAERQAVTDVAHRRQVHFMRQAKSWIVTDRIDIEQAHDFTQTWCFGPEYDEDEVVADSATQTLRTRQSGAPNLTLHQFGTPSLDYKKYFGVYGDEQILGWVGIFADRDNWQYTPAVDMHANWRGEGKQLLITLMLPSPDEQAPIKEIHDAGNGTVQGFDAELSDGTRIFYRAATEATALEADGMSAEAQSLLVVRNPAGDRSGMVLGATRFAGEPVAQPDFEFSQSGAQTTPVTAPDTFRWVETEQGLQPIYRQQP